jgi:hypothetical protein
VTLSGTYLESLFSFDSDPPLRKLKMNHKKYAIRSVGRRVSRIDIIFNKMLVLNTIYGENFKFFYSRDKELFKIKH